MALVTEIVFSNIVRHYSDANFKIKQIETGDIYDDAYDLIPCKFTYEETDEPIEEVES